MQLLAVRLAVPAAWQRDDEASNCSTVDASACLGDAERMMRLCPASCLGLAAPDNSSSHSCQLWAQRDECIKNGGYMKDASILRRARNVESARGSAGKRRGRAQPAGARHKLVCDSALRPSKARCSELSASGSLESCGAVRYWYLCIYVDQRTNTLTLPASLVEASLTASVLSAPAEAAQARGKSSEHWLPCAWRQRVRQGSSCSWAVMGCHGLPVGLILLVGCHGLSPHLTSRVLASMKSPWCVIGLRVRFGRVKTSARGGRRTVNTDCRGMASLLLFQCLAAAPARTPTKTCPPPDRQT